MEKGSKIRLIIKKVKNKRRTNKMKTRLKKKGEERPKRKEKVEERYKKR